MKHTFSYYHDWVNNWNGAFAHPFVWRNDISTAQGKKELTEVGDNFFPRVVKISFLHTKGCGNVIPIRKWGYSYIKEK